MRWLRLVPWALVASTIYLNVAGEQSAVRVPGFVEMQLTPILDLMSGEPKEVHITYPKGGFFWNDAKIATTQTIVAKASSITP